MIPTATSVNIKTGTSWEGTGVTPDIKIASTFALQKAIIESYTVLKNTTSIKELKQLYEWMIPQYQSQLNPQTPKADFINSITGKYGQDNRIEIENGNLYFINANGKYKMSYMSDTNFAVEGKQYRLRFSDANSQAKYYEAFWMDGGTEKATKNSNN
jgi:hypothetical protein